MRYTLIALVLAGCAATPEQMAQQTNWDVCRFTMGGPHAQVAENERRRRGLDCTPLYPAIAAQLQGEASAVQNYLRGTRPAPQQPRSTYCRTVRNGNVYNTACD